MWVVFGLDVDDCLVTEYKLVANDANNFRVHFSGELYLDIKTKIAALVASNPDCKIVISSYSFRQSFYLDTYNSACHSSLWSCFLLAGLAQQLAQELACDILLDTTWLADLDPAQVSFAEVLANPEAYLDSQPDSYSGKNIIERCKEHRFLLAGEFENPDRVTNQQYLKVVRLRYILHSLISKFHIDYAAPMKVYLYDDQAKYLTGIKAMFAIQRPNIIISTIQNNPFGFRADGKEVMLSRNVLTKLDEFNAMLGSRQLSNQFQVWTRLPSVIIKDIYKTYTQHTPPVLIQIALLAQFQMRNAIFRAHLQPKGVGGRNLPTLRPYPIGKTILEICAASGNNWGTGMFPAFPGHNL